MTPETRIGKGISYLLGAGFTYYLSVGSDIVFRVATDQDLSGMYFNPATVRTWFWCLSWVLFVGVFGRLLYGAYQLMTGIEELFE